MKICYLADASSIHTQKWVKYFAEKGYEVHLISFESSSEMLNQSYVSKFCYYYVDMLFRSRNKVFPLKFFKLAKIKKIIEKIKPDVFHAFYMTNYGYFAAKMDLHPLIVTSMGSDLLPLPTESWLMRKIKKQLAKTAISGADCVTIDNCNLYEPIRKLVKENHPFPAIETVYFGVDTKRFCVNVDARERSTNIISTRNLYLLYNVETLIRAIHHVKVAGKLNGYMCNIIGKGPEKRKLEMLVEDLDLSYDVLFVGKVDNSELHKYLQQASIYVSTALSDSSSVSLFEAMSCGLPVVVTDIEGNQEWVKHNINGYLFQRNHPMDLADKIALLIEHRENIALFGANNRKIAEENFDYEANIQKMEKIYEGLVYPNDV